MQAVIARIFRTGIRSDLPKSLKRQLWLANQLAILYNLVVNLPYAIVTYQEYPSQVHLVFISGALCLVVLLLNTARAYLLSRLIISIVPSVSLTLLHAWMVNVGEPPISALMVMIVSTSTLPFMFFNLRELPLLLGAVVINLSGIIFYAPLNAILEDGMPATAFESGGVAVFFLFLGAFAVNGMILTFVIQGNYFQRKSEKLVAETEQKTAELLNSEQELRKSIRQIEDNRKAEAERTWAADGMAQFSRLLREHEQTEKLATDLISEVVRYLDANQGGLYLTEVTDEEVQLVRAGAYAYDRKKFEKHAVIPGEGLLGQAYLEQATIYLTDIPEGYASIQSGLGDAGPTALLIVPLKANDKIEGLIEVASFESLPPYKIDFLEKLAEAIGAALANIRINERTRELLEETRRSSQELQAREEEMRQNMEELAATQEEMQRKEQAYLLRIAELEKSTENGPESGARD